MRPAWAGHGADRGAMRPWWARHCGSPPRRAHHGRISPGLWRHAPGMGRAARSLATVRPDWEPRIGSRRGISPEWAQGGGASDWSAHSGREVPESRQRRARNRRGSFHSVKARKLSRRHCLEPPSPASPPGFRCPVCALFARRACLRAERAPIPTRRGRGGEQWGLEGGRADTPALRSATSLPSACRSWSFGTRGMCGATVSRSGRFGFPTARRADTQNEHGPFR